MCERATVCDFVDVRHVPSLEKRDSRNVGFWQIPHDDKTTSRDLASITAIIGGNRPNQKTRRNRFRSAMPQSIVEDLDRGAARVQRMDRTASDRLAPWEKYALRSALLTKTGVPNYTDNASARWYKKRDLLQVSQLGIGTGDFR